MLVHSLQGCDVFEWIPWLLPHSVGSNGVVYLDVLNVLHPSLQISASLFLHEIQMQYAIEVRQDAIFSRFGLQWTKHYLPCGLLLVSSIA